MEEEIKKITFTLEDLKSSLFNVKMLINNQMKPAYLKFGKLDKHELTISQL